MPEPLWVPTCALDRLIAPCRLMAAEIEDLVAREPPHLREAAARAAVAVVAWRLHVVAIIEPAVGR